MPATHGRFVWYELMTTDVPAAKAFYGQVVGWNSQDSGVSDVDYTLFTAGEIPVTGLMDLPEDARKAGAPPFWLGYVAVDDVDASVAQAIRLGGAVHLPPRDIPTVGRIAAIGDPQGATIALFKWLDPAQNQPAAQGATGHVGWHELMATDLQAAFPFYAEMFGWQKAEAVDIGAMGTYQLFSTGEQPVGGMYTKPPMVPVPAWLYYFNVGEIDAAVARVAASGGQTLNGPMQVPGGSWIAQCRDPQGATFALVGSRA